MLNLDYLLCLEPSKKFVVGLGVWGEVGEVGV